MKYIILLILWINFLYSPLFAYTWDIHTTLTEIKEKNAQLENKYIDFNKSTETYIKILSEEKEFTKEKANAYESALNDFNFWFKILGWMFLILLTIVWIVFGIYEKIKLNDFKKQLDQLNDNINNINNKYKKIDEELNSKISSFNKDLSKIMDKKIEETNDILNKITWVNEELDGSKEQNKTKRTQLELLTYIIQENFKQGQTFVFKEIYDKSEKIFKENYPNNKFIDAKILQLLQILRNQWIIKFIDKWTYKVSKNN